MKVEVVDLTHNFPPSISHSPAQEMLFCFSDHICDLPSREAYVMPKSDTKKS